MITTSTAIETLYQTKPEAYQIFYGLTSLRTAQGHFNRGLQIGEVVCEEFAQQYPQYRNFNVYARSPKQIRMFTKYFEWLKIRATTGGSISGIAVPKNPTKGV